MPARLIITKSELERHFSSVEGLLTSHASFSARPQLEIAWQLDPIVAGVVGSGCERVRRNRGPDTFVYPSWSLAGDEIAWLGYREEWSLERASSHGPRYSFRSMSATVHFGRLGMVLKPQIFRMEWSGFTSWFGGPDAFQADGAGHPHWQFGAIESLAPSDLASEVQELLELFREDPAQDVAREFDSAEAASVSSPSSTNLSRLHFASAAAWWKNGPEGSQAHSPNSILELSNWLEKALDYVGKELARLS